MSGQAWSVHPRKHELRAQSETSAEQNRLAAPIPDDDV